MEHTLDVTFLHWEFPEGVACWRDTMIDQKGFLIITLLKNLYRQC